MASYVVNYADWKDEQFMGYLRSLEENPERYHRKPWEFARILHSLDAAGALHEKSIGLGLGCGDERLMYMLAKHCYKVIASDLYDLDSGWSEWRMLPAYLYDACPISTGYPRERLEIKTMNMLHSHLMYPPNYFDYVWSTSSIEHLANVAELEALFRSVNSVLKPGGCFVFATEWHVSGPYRSWPHLNLFDGHLLTKLAHRGSFEIFGGLPPEPIPSSRMPQHEPIAQEQPGWVDRMPHLYLSREGTVFTSVVATLRKIEHIAARDVG